MRGMPGRGSNPHVPFEAQDLKSCASASFATRRTNRESIVSTSYVGFRIGICVCIWLIVRAFCPCRDLNCKIDRRPIAESLSGPRADRTNSRHRRRAFPRRPVDRRRPYRRARSAPVDDRSAPHDGMAPNNFRGRLFRRDAMITRYRVNAVVQGRRPDYPPLFSLTAAPYLTAILIFATVVAANYGVKFLIKVR
jgi:hypothetical protein